jgi:endonuclease/exonuclease/phosphatase family metal-dependent hydrolase
MNLFWKILGCLISIPLLYVVGCILYAKLTYLDPIQLIVLEENTQVTPIPKRELSALIWNIGYGGLGAKSDFFKDGGKMVRPEKADFDSYFDGILKTLNSDSSDFQLLQEVDTNSKRSYFHDEISFIRAQVQESHPFSSFAENYKVNFVPVPFLNPMGKVHSGLLSLSKFKPYRTERHQLPGAFGFPDQLFFLRRCLLVQYFKVDSANDLVVINVHNSAYDDSGKLKKEEMAYLKHVLTDLNAKGMYILCGGDWNQCPPDFDYRALAKGREGDYFQTNVDSSFLGFGKWRYDPNVGTNRKNDKAYQERKSFITIIDFFWHSDNIEISAVDGISNNFQYSDHQPVKIKFKLK